MRGRGLLMLVGMALACSSDVGQSNVDACERYRKAMLDVQCGDVDLSAMFPEDFCEDYETAMCDMAPFFDCLQGSAQCDEDLGELLIDTTGCEAEADCNNR